MFLFIPWLSRMTSEISHGSLLTARFRTRLLKSHGKQGRLQGFDWGGGGQNIMWAHTHHEREARSPLRPWSRARLRALNMLEALRVLNALLCYLRLIFNHSDTKNIVDQNRGGGGCMPSAPPSKSATGIFVWNEVGRGCLVAIMRLHLYISQRPMKTFYEKQKQNSSFEHSHCLVVPRC